MTPISPSRARCYLACPRRYQWKYQARIEAIKEDAAPRNYGRLFHQALCAQSAEPLNMIEDQWERDAAKLLFEAYLDDPKPYKITHRELRVEDEHVHGWVDAIVEDADGLLWVLDYKTKGATVNIEPDSAVWEGLDLDLQMTAYIHAARAQGIPVAGAIYEVVKRPSASPQAVKSKKDLEAALNAYAASAPPEWVAEAKTALGQKGRVQVRECLPMMLDRLAEAMVAEPHKWWARRKVHRVESDLVFGVQSMRQTRQMIALSEASGCFPMNPGSCRTPFPCDYAALCQRASVPGEYVGTKPPEGYTKTQEAIADDE